MALLLHLWLSLSLLLALLLAASSHGAPSGEDSYDPSLCIWQPSTCGNVSINYPFYLYTETAALLDSESSYYCGYPGLGILCEDGKQAVLQLGGDNYTVSGIDYKNFAVSLADQEVFDHESCPRIDHDVTFPSSSWLSFPQKTVDYLFIFLSCNFTMAWSPPKTIIPITCPSYEGHGRSFVALPPGDVPYEDWQEECKKIKLPVLKDVLWNWNWSDPRNRTAWSSDGFGSALRAGFQLVWKWEQKRLSSCDQCEGPNGHCGYNQAGEFVRCLCSDGRIGTQNVCSSGHPKKTKIYVAASTSCLLLLCLIILAFYFTHKYGSVLSTTGKSVYTVCPQLYRVSFIGHTANNTFAVCQSLRPTVKIEHTVHFSLPCAILQAHGK